MTGPDNPTGPTGPGRLAADVAQALQRPGTERVITIFDAPRPGPGFCWPGPERTSL